MPPETAFCFVAEEIRGPIPGCPDQKMGPTLPFNPQQGEILKDGDQPTVQALKKKGGSVDGEEEVREAAFLVFVVVFFFFFLGDFKNFGKQCIT